MSVLLQVSDPHFGTEQPNVVEALLEFAARVAPERVLLTGDITQRARRAQFRAARAFCDRLPWPVLAVPGNHDIPLFNLLARCFWPYAGYRRAFGDELEPVWESERWRVIGLNSTHPSRHKNGAVTEAMIERTCDWLRSGRRDALRLVALHHPLHAITRHDQDNLARGASAALHAFARAGADLVLGGHIHLPYVRPLSPLIETLPAQLWAIQAGTAVSHRIRDGRPNSVHLLRALDAPAIGCDVEQWDYRSELRSFARSKVTRIERHH